MLLEQERAARMEDRKRKREEKARDKVIREERRQQKAAEKQAKKEERMKRQLVHESVERNGVPRVESGDTHLGLRDAIEYSPYVLCPECHQAVRENRTIEGVCERCHYGKEVNGEDEKLKTEGRPAPGSGDGEKKVTAAPAGQQLILEL